MISNLSYIEPDETEDGTELQNTRAVSLLEVGEGFPLVADTCGASGFETGPDVTDRNQAIVLSKASLLPIDPFLATARCVSRSSTWT